MNLILASGSPQRRAILEQIGVPHEVRVSDVDELEEGPPHEVALENAHRKAVAVAAAVNAEGTGRSRPVLGVDTLVSLGSRIYGKPRDAEHAAAMLSELSGRRHVVISGLCLVSGGESRTAAASTIVEFRTLHASAVAAYVATQEWEGRAGAYAIQGRGATLVARIEGDYLNVVGLPVAALIELAPSLFAA